MNVIYKYPVKPDASIELPQGARILSIHVQHSVPCLWALVNPVAPKEVRRFHTIPTGQPFDDSGLTYIGTFHGIEGWMVFHLFEETRGEV